MPSSPHPHKPKYLPRWPLQVIDMPVASSPELRQGSSAVGIATTTFFIPKSVITELYTSGISVGTANTITNPLGTRLHMIRHSFAVRYRYGSPKQLKALR